MLLNDYRSFLIDLKIGLGCSPDTMITIYLEEGKLVFQVIGPNGCPALTIPTECYLMSREKLIKYIKDWYLKC